MKIVERTTCSACHSGRGETRFHLWDDRYGFPEEFPMNQCLDCRSFYLARCVAEEAMGDLYRSYYPEAGVPSELVRETRVRQQVRKLLRLAPLSAGQNFQGLNVLDVGCGGGETSPQVLETGGTWTGLEIDAKRVEALKRLGLKCLCGTPETLEPEMKERFDVIFACQVLEHSFQPSHFLQACRGLLKPNGRIILSTPNGNSRFGRKYGKDWIHWHVPYHVVIFSPAGIQQLANRSGFQMISLETATPATWKVWQKAHQPVLRGQKGEWCRGSLSKVEMMWNGILARIGDRIRGDGDMMVVVLHKA